MSEQRTTPGSPLEGQREAAKVTRCTCERHEHYGHVTGEIMFSSPSGGWGQGYGDICLDEKGAEAWTHDICALFGVKTLAECVGRNCFVLRSWGRFGDTIDGIEVDGKRFTTVDFIARNYPDKAETVLDKRRAALRGNIDRAARDIQRWMRDLETADEDYVEWSDFRATQR